MAGRGNDGITPPRRRRLLRALVVLGACAALASPSVAHAGISLPPSDPADNPLLTLQNQDIRIGADLDWGGALSVLSGKKTGRNLINRHDVGRLVQQSYYGAGKYAGCGFGMNPVQGGDRAGNESGVQAATRQGGTIYVRSRPLDWCLNGQHPDATYENWYTLDGRQVQRTCTLDVAVPAGVPASQQFPIKVVATAGNGLQATASGNVSITNTGAAWEFSTSGDAEGWAPAHSLAAFDVSGGLLHTSVTGGDPYMVQSQPLAIDATNGVNVQIAVQTTNPGTGQIFFSTPSGGFSETNSVTFPITGNGMNTYQITIPPQDGPLTGLRFDPPDGAGDISIDYIRAASQ